MRTIRNETPADYRAVEELTRLAFWNVNMPGCDEHYLVHIMRSHPDFIPELDFVMEEDGKIVGNVIYTRATLIGRSGRAKNILTFGPLSVLPEYQRRGYGKALLEHSFEKAVEMGFDTIVIFGNPENYYSRGFKNGSRFSVNLNDSNSYPVALLVKELVPGALDGEKWMYRESPLFEPPFFQPDSEEAKDFENTFPPLPKEYRPSQELFYIYSHGRITLSE